MIVDINLNARHGILTIIDAFSDYRYDEDLIVNILHRKGNFISVGIYPVLCSIVNEVRKSGFKVNLNFETPGNCSQLNYAERMNFLECLGVQYSVPYGRNNPNGRFIEILNIPANSYGISIDLMDVFQNDFNLDESSAYDLSFIIGELYCNTSIHSKSTNGCYFFCQKYPSKDYLELYIVDSGIGIVDSMRKNDEYKGLDDIELLPLSLRFQEGSGNGRGHGLYFVSEFVKRNKGEMLYISGNSHIFITNGSEIPTFNNNYNYRGVILRLRFKFKVLITTNELMREKQYTNV